MKFYSYSRIGTNENNMKIRVWTLLWTIIRNARNHCQDVDNCGDEDHCQDVDNCGDEDHCRYIPPWDRPLSDWKPLSG